MKTGSSFDMAINVRRASPDDVKGIAETYTTSFYDKRIKKRGNLIRHLFKEYIRQIPEYFVVAEDTTNGRLVGMRNAYLYKDSEKKHIAWADFERKCKWRLRLRKLMLLAGLDRDAWHDVRQRLIHGKQRKEKEKYKKTTHEFDEPLKDGSKSAYGFDMCVHPDYRRRGISRMLFDKEFELLKADGCEVLLLEVLKENTAALKNDLGYGFKIIGEKSDEYLLARWL